MDVVAIPSWYVPAGNLRVIELLTTGALAVVAGVVSFTSPCALPLVPGYVAFVSGMDDPSDAPRRVWAGAVLFVVGFGLTFTALGAAATAVGFFLASRADVLDRVAGVVIVVMGVSMLGVIRIPWLQRERRFRLDTLPQGPGGALPLGAAFALGWTPCVGPVLASILATASTQTSVARGALLLACYAVGLSLPFLVIARGLVRGRRTWSWLVHHTRRIEVAGGVLLIGMGIAISTGGWTILMSRMLGWYARFGWPPI